MSEVLTKKELIKFIQENCWDNYGTIDWNWIEGAGAKGDKEVLIKIRKILIE